MYVSAPKHMTQEDLHYLLSQDYATPVSPVGVHKGLVEPEEYDICYCNCLY